MILVAILASLLVGGAVFLCLKRSGQSSGTRGKDSHIV